MHPRNKFGAKPTFIDEIRFASKLEAKRYQQLKLLERAGHVVSFECQPKFELYAGIRYIADFRVNWKDGQTTVEDVKGVQTEAFKLKRKLFESLYGPLTVLTASALGKVYVPG